MNIRSILRAAFAGFTFARCEAFYIILWSKWAVSIPKLRPKPRPAFNTSGGKRYIHPPKAGAVRWVVKEKSGWEVLVCSTETETQEVTEQLAFARAEDYWQT